MEMLGVFVVFVIACFIIGYYREGVRIKNYKKQAKYQAEQSEKARKKAAFDAWYATLPPHEQYLIDKQLAHSDLTKSIAAGMLARNLKDFIDPLE